MIRVILGVTINRTVLAVLSFTHTPLQLHERSTRSDVEFKPDAACRIILFVFVGMLRQDAIELHGITSDKRNLFAPLIYQDRLDFELSQ
jgi:hypothetical protein